MFDEATLDSIWGKGLVIDNLDPSMYRKDACGALIMRDKYGMKNPFGWVVDHVFPVALGGDDRIENLRPLHYQNNISKSDDYPSYTSAVSFNGRTNVALEKNLTVNAKLRERLRQYYQGA